jgi:hypothetical protein
LEVSFVSVKKLRTVPPGATEIVLVIPKGALASEQPKASDEATAAVHRGRTASDQPTVSDQVKISRITSTSRFAVELLIAARLMANKASRATGEPSHELRSFVTAAVVLAYSFLEAGLNEFIYLNAQASEILSVADRTAIADIASQDLRGEWRESKTTLELFNVILRTLNKEELAKGHEPYGAAEAVRSLRNLLVHPKPIRVTTFSDDPNEDLSRQQKITTKLLNYLKLDRSATFPAQVLTAKCAAWAVSSSLAFFAEFVKRSGVDPGFLTDGRI